MLKSSPRLVNTLVTLLASTTATCLAQLPSSQDSAGPSLRDQPSATQPTRADDGQWLTPGRDYANTRYSELNGIRADNVSSLHVAWTFSTGVNRGHEAPAIVAGSTMYLITPFPNLIYALDLNKVANGETAYKWRYEPKPEAAAQGVACCDFVNRCCSYADGKIYFSTLDVQAGCVDAITGSEIWKTKLGSINKGESITMAPLVAKGKVYVGNSGGEFGVRGWLKCLDAN